MTAGPTIAETLAAVKGYLDAGLSVIPVRLDGTKAPAESGWRHYSEIAPTTHETYTWFGPDAGGRHGVGIPCGTASGNLAVLDFEYANIYDLWLAELPADTADYLDDCPLARTPGKNPAGGRHVYVRLPEPVPGTVLARRPDPADPDRPRTLVEVRGHGHQVVAPGSPRAVHDSGRPYAWERRGWLDGRSPGPVPFTVWFAWCELAASLNEFVKPVAERPPAPPRDRLPSDDDPGRDFNRRGTWEEAGLFDAGWSWSRELEHDRGFVRRPGKDSGTSGTAGMVSSRANGWPLFFCFTSNAPPFEQDGTYDRFGAYARLRHRGDFRAAARDLLDAGYGRREAGPKPNGVHRVAPAASGGVMANPGHQGPDAPPTPTPTPAAGKGAKSRFRFADSDEFLAGDYRPRWLVPRVLVRGQPAVIAGPSKGMKTSLLIDLAVSMATATPFLGVFPVRERVRTAVVSGESGEFTLKETCLRVLAAKQLPPSALSGWLKWEFSLPTFSDVASMSDFAGHLGRVEADVVVIDPTYLALGDVDAKNMFEMGRALRSVGEGLGRARPGLTAVLVHHANRLLPVGEPMELQHLAYSGLEQFARQFILLNRREPYRNDGEHDLWVRAGGSAGHGGLWAVRVSEGVVGEDFAGRRWDVTVRSPEEAGEAARAGRDGDARDRRRQVMHEDERAVLLAIDAEVTGSGRGGATMNRVRELTGFSYGRARDAIARLVEAGAVEGTEFAKAFGHGSTQTVSGFRRTPD